VAVKELDLSQLPAFLTKAAEDVASLDYRKPLQYCAYLIANATKDCFKQSRDPDGNPWLPLKQPRKTGKKVPLWDTGRLVASVSSAAAGTKELSSLQLIFGTNVEYAAVHQYGGTNNIPAWEWKPGQKIRRFEIGSKTIFTKRVKAHSVTIPARPFLGIGDKLAKQIDEVFAAFLEANAFPSAA
jgi:phage gpG-like protein